MVAYCTFSIEFSVGDFVYIMKNFDSDSQDHFTFVSGMVLVVRVVDEGDIRVNTLDNAWESNHWIFEANYDKIALIYVFSVNF